MGVKLCIIYTRLCKWTVIVYISTVTVHRVNHFFILFSLSSIKLLLFLNHYNNPARQNQLKINQTHLLKINQNQPSINRKLTQNQQKINPNTSTQTNLHRDTLAKKKKKYREIGAYGNNQCLTRMIGACGYGSCLTDACGSELWRSVLAWSKLWIGACDWDGVD